MKESVRPIEATARQHHSPKIHSPVTVVTAFKIMIITILRSVSARLNKIKFVFVRRWRNFTTETQIKLLPTIAAIMIKVNTAIWATTLTEFSSLLLVFSCAIVAGLVKRLDGTFTTHSNRESEPVFVRTFCAQLRRMVRKHLSFFCNFHVGQRVQTPAALNHLKLSVYCYGNHKESIVFPRMKALCPLANLTWKQVKIWI